MRKIRSENVLAGVEVSGGSDVTWIGPQVTALGGEKAGRWWWTSLPRVGTLLTDRQAAAGEPWIWMKVKGEKF